MKCRQCQQNDAVFGFQRIVKESDGHAGNDNLVSMWCCYVCTLQLMREGFVSGVAVGPEKDHPMDEVAR